MISANVATTCLAIVDNFEPRLAIIVADKRLVIERIVIAGIITIVSNRIIAQEQSITVLTQRTDLFLHLQKDQYSLLLTHANIDFDFGPFRKPSCLDLVIVSFGRIGPFATEG